MKKLILCFVLGYFCISCNKSDDYQPVTTYPNVISAFGSKIDLNNLYNYANQPIPNYITKNNVGGNPISDKGATLGRVLFYDKNLSANNTISCASCHIQANAFGDPAVASVGFNGGTTSRHSMRLINTRFANEFKFFWDERATSLENQTTQPIQNHIEMGFSGANGDAPFTTLVSKLQAIGYYKELFQYVYGSETITEIKIQLALAQFIRSIQSFDSKYDIGRAQAANEGQAFVNFSATENTGKNLFLSPPVFDANSNRINGGLGCAGCHAAPEFDIDPNSRNNGIINNLGGVGTDLTNTRAPSLRDLVNQAGNPNGPMMHNGNFTTLNTIIGHYGAIGTPAINTNLDPRLAPNGIGQKLNLTQTEVQSVIAFLKTLTGSNVYTDPKWSSPF
jgi:cytochrome c peroxidase